MKLLLRHHICTPSRAFSGFGTSTYLKYAFAPEALREPDLTRICGVSRRTFTNNPG